MVTIAGFVIAISVLMFFVNLIVSVRRGEVAVGNVWESRSPEWHGAFAHSDAQLSGAGACGW